MFGIGLPELILIMGIALIVVGPDKLPDMAKSIAKGLLELKKTASSLKESFSEELEVDSDNDPWKQNLEEKYPNLPSTSINDPVVPEGNEDLVFNRPTPEDEKEEEADSTPDLSEVESADEDKEDKPTA